MTRITPPRGRFPGTHGHHHPPSTTKTVCHLHPPIRVRRTHREKPLRPPSRDSYPTDVTLVHDPLSSTSDGPLLPPAPPPRVKRVLQQSRLFQGQGPEVRVAEVPGEDVEFKFAE